MPDRSPPLRRAGVLLALTLCAFGCRNGDDGNGSGTEPPPAGGEQNATFRAIAGVSMGAYGALNLGTKHPELFGMIGALGGPVDLGELLRFLERGLTVQPRTALPEGPDDDDLTFDHSLSYPGRDTQLRMVRDLFLALGNPFLHHPDESRRYLASESEPARIRTDDWFGDFTVPTNVRGFQDGGDANRDGRRQLGEAPAEPADVLLAAGGSIAAIAGPSAPAPTAVGERQLADLDGDGTFDVGDGIVLNLGERFTDADGNGVFEPNHGDVLADTGLDGVAGTGDFGEGNGRLDEDPDLAAWRAEDPLARLRGLSAARILAQRLYMDVGTRDEFGFAKHYASLVQVLKDKGVAVEERDGFQGSCLQVPHPAASHLLIRYDGGHLGIPEADEVSRDLLEGDVCGSAVIWQRVGSLLGFLDAGFPDGVRGPAGSDLTGDVRATTLESPALARTSAVGRTVVVYRPPAFFNTLASFPIVYFLGGYGQKPEDFQRLGLLLDSLIVSGQIQNLFVAVLPGAGGNRGSFFLDHRVPADQAPDALKTTGRYETSILEDLIPQVESRLLEGRVKK